MRRVLRSGVERLKWRHNVCIMAEMKIIIDCVELKKGKTRGRSEMLRERRRERKNKKERKRNKQGCENNFHSLRVP